RSAIGYGLDTQVFVLDSFVTGYRGGIHLAKKKARFVYDRAHDVLLDQVATGGIVAAAIWLALLVGVLVGGARPRGRGPGGGSGTSRRMSRRDGRSHRGRRDRSRDHRPVRLVLDLRRSVDGPRAPGITGARGSVATCGGTMDRRPRRNGGDGLLRRGGHDRVG